MWHVTCEMMIIRCIILEEVFLTFDDKCASGALPSIKIVHKKEITQKKKMVWPLSIYEPVSHRKQKFTMCVIYKKGERRNCEIEGEFFVIPGIPTVNITSCIISPFEITCNRWKIWKVCGIYEWNGTDKMFIVAKANLFSNVSFFSKCDVGTFILKCKIQYFELQDWRLHFLSELSLSKCKN